MATRRPRLNTQRNQTPQNARVENPFLHIPFSRRDLAGYESGGGGKKEFVPVDADYRNGLIASLTLAREELSAVLRQYPTTLSGVVFKLRETAIAKSHRPIDLAFESGLVPAGHGKLDEMVVGANSTSLDLLERVIRDRNTKVIRANLSAILQIEPWSRARRNPEGTDFLRERGAALVRLFRYTSEDATASTLASVQALFEELGVEFERLVRRRNSILLRISNIENIAQSSLERILNHPGIRTVLAEPMYGTPIRPTVANTAPTNLVIPQPHVGLPTVGVFDTGVAPTATALAPWVVSSDPFVLVPDTNHVHGTAVASLVAIARLLNHDNEWLPTVGCLVHDVAGMEAAGQGFGILAYRLREALINRPEIRVWNLSLGSPVPCDDQQFSWFAQTLDDLSDEFDVLFVVAAGNYLGLPRRGWPDVTALQDRISEPADSVRALTVGSITHLQDANALLNANSPASYSRRGPGPVFSPKPDIVHLGGGVHAPWSSGSTSTRVLCPENQIQGDFGTSFAAPIASSMAAHTWAAMDGHEGLLPSPALVKALIIHAAQLSSPEYAAWERRYYGAGLPKDVLTTLYDSDDSFTLVFEAQIIPGNFRWRKSPYPIPNVLMHEGKFRGEVIITAAYAPPLDQDAGAEYVRANVELSFGVLDGDLIKGKVPLEREPGANTAEKSMIENGGKWAPVKLHRARFPNGIAGAEWALQAQCTMRAYEPILAEPLNVTIVVTLRALDGDTGVRASGVRALAATNWITQQLPVQVPIAV